MTRDEANSLTPSYHFLERCRDRGVDGDHGQLYRCLAWARANNRIDLIDFVMKIDDFELWRFATASGARFYAGFRSTKVGPSTIYTQDMITARKRTRRIGKKKNTKSPVKPRFDVSGDKSTNRL